MTITLTREEAQQVLDALDEYRDSTEDFRVANRCISLIETLRARLAQPETPYEIGNRLYREGKGVSSIPTAVDRDDQIGEALRGFEDARLAQPEPEYKSYQCQQCGEVIGWLGRVMPFHKCVRPEPEPVAWMAAEVLPLTHIIKAVVRREKDDQHKVPLYTAPPQRREWQGLTDEEICTTWNESPRIELWVNAFARAIEAKLKGKNT